MVLWLCALKVYEKAFFRKLFRRAANAALGRCLFNLDFGVFEKAAYQHVEAYR